MFATDDSLEEDDSLFTARLCLTTPRASDADALAALANNRNVAANLASMPHPYARTDALEWIGRVATATGPARAFLVRLGDSGGAVIGGAAVGPEPTAGDTEIGYWIGEPHWGHGYATEAAQALLDLAFSRHRVEEVWAACRMTNEASRRVLVKCGFQWSGTGLRRSRALGGMVSIERYRLDRKAWASLRAWGHGSTR